MLWLINSTSILPYKIKGIKKNQLTNKIVNIYNNEGKIKINVYYLKANK